MLMRKLYAFKICSSIVAQWMERIGCDPNTQHTKHPIQSLDDARCSRQSEHRVNTITDYNSRYFWMISARGLWMLNVEFICCDHTYGMNSCCDLFTTTFTNFKYASEIRWLWTNVLASSENAESIWLRVGAFGNMFHATVR